MTQDARRAAIRKILKADVEAAMKWRDVAAAKFHAAMERAVSGAPDPEELRKLSTEYSQALRAIERALKRLNAFLAQGVIPPDFPQH
jgi:GMP synthase PP-ATPase subunit